MGGGGKKGAGRGALAGEACRVGCWCKEFWGGGGGRKRLVW